MIRSNTQPAGFSAVELMITMFIGFLFIAMGYQLFTVINNRSIDENAYARASQETEYYLRQLINGNKPNTLTMDFSNCPVTPPFSQGTSTDAQGNTFTIRWECPSQSDLPKLRKLTVSRHIKDTEVTHASYFTVP